MWNGLPGEDLLLSRKEGKQEIHSFCRTTLAEMVKLERMQCHAAEPSLNTFARVDLSVYKDVNGAFHWYVNEITRAPDLFRGPSEATEDVEGEMGILGRLGFHYARAFVSRIVSHWYQYQDLE